MPKDLGFTAEQTDEILRTLAVFRGDAKLASDDLSKRGLEIKQDTLRHWKRKRYTERYMDFAAAIDKDLEHHKLEMREKAALLHQAELKALDATLQAIERGEVKDPSTALRNIATAGGINLTNLMHLEGKPQIVEHRHSIDESLAKLVELGVVEGTAEEITEAEEVRELARSIPESKSPPQAEGLARSIPAEG